MSTWIPVEKLPRKPRTPYEVYLVWAVVDLPNGTGWFYLAQFGRDKMAWEPVLNALGNPCTITHWRKLPKEPKVRGKRTKIEFISRFRRTT